MTLDDNGLINLVCGRAKSIDNGSIE